MIIRDRIKELRRVKAGSLIPHPKNWRTHPQAQADALRGILSEVGYADALIVRETPAGLMLVDGHLRAETTPDLEVPVLVTDLTAEEADKLLASLDPLAAMAEANGEKLASLLASIETESEALKSMFDQLAKDHVAQKEVHEDEVPPVPVDPITKPGDLWLLGDHRLLCGDSTKADDVKRLVDGERAAACITDPPYSVNYDESHKHRGGDAAVHAAYKEADIDPSQLLCFMKLVPADVMVWSYPIDRHFFVLSDAYKCHGWEFKKELVWIKDSFSFWMSAKYQQKHEPIMLAVRKGKPIGGDIPANATTVFEYPRPKSHDMHPTAKPIAMWCEFVKFHVPLGGLVYEPFCGSGTTLIAAEQLNRKCYGMEISPAYCDVIVTRWENLTGKKAVRE